MLLSSFSNVTELQMMKRKEGEKVNVDENLDVDDGAGRVGVANTSHSKKSLGGEDEVKNFYKRDTY